MPWWAWTLIGIFGFIYVVGATARDKAEREQKVRDSKNLEKLANVVKE